MLLDSTTIRSYFFQILRSRNFRPVPYISVRRTKIRLREAAKIGKQRNTPNASAYICNDKDKDRDKDNEYGYIPYYSLSFVV